MKATSICHRKNANHRVNFAAPGAFSPENPALQGLLADFEQWCIQNEVIWAYLLEEDTGEFIAAYGLSDATCEPMLEMQAMEAAEKFEYEELVRRLIKPGDLLTHTRCMGCLEEHIYTGTTDGQYSWLRGKPTRNTINLGGSKFEADDISPLNVTHINRVPVEAVDLLAVKNKGKTQIERAS